MTANVYAVCPGCGGDGKETCTNPDHGLISALSWHDIGRIGCPCCGKSYNGVKNFAPIKEIFEVKFVVDNE